MATTSFSSEDTLSARIVFSEVISPIPVRPLKRKISQLSNLQDQPRYPNLASARRESTPPARLFDWLLQETAYAINRGQSRSDSFLLELNAGERSIEGAIHNSKLVSQTLLMDSNDAEDLVSIPTRATDTMTPTGKTPGSEKTTKTNQSGIKSLDTSDRRYRRDVLGTNGIIVDSFGMLTNEEVLEAVNIILNKERRSPSPDYDEIKNIAEDDECEGESSLSHHLSRTCLFPQKRRGRDYIHFGHSDHFNTYKTVLPMNKKWPDIKEPRPDLVISYNKHGKGKGGFTEEQKEVILEPKIRDYTYPTGSSAMLPYFIYELKTSDAKGVIYAATNQAAASCTMAVRARQKLKEFLDANKSPEQRQQPTPACQSMVFAITGEPTGMILWVHFCNAENEYVMHKLDAFSFHRNEDIKRVSKAVKNIMDWGMDERMKEICADIDAFLREPET